MGHLRSAGHLEEARPRVPHPVEEPQRAGHLVQPRQSRRSNMRCLCHGCCWRHGHQRRRVQRHGHQRQRVQRHGHQRRRVQRHGHQRRRVQRHGHQSQRVQLRKMLPAPSRREARSVQRPHTGRHRRAAQRSAALASRHLWRSANSGWAQGSELAWRMSAKRPLLLNAHRRQCSTGGLLAE